MESRLSWTPGVEQQVRPAECRALVLRAKAWHGQHRERERTSAGRRVRDRYLDDTAEITRLAKVPADRSCRGDRLTRVPESAGGRCRAPPRRAGSGARGRARSRNSTEGKAQHRSERDAPGLPAETTSNQVTSNQVTSNQVASNQVTSNQTTSNQATSNQATVAVGGGQSDAVLLPPDGHLEIPPLRCAARERRRNGDQWDKAFSSPGHPPGSDRRRPTCWRHTDGQ